MHTHTHTLHTHTRRDRESYDVDACRTGKVGNGCVLSRGGARFAHGNVALAVITGTPVRGGARLAHEDIAFGEVLAVRLEVAGEDGPSAEGPAVGAVFADERSLLFV